MLCALSVIVLSGGAPASAAAQEVIGSHPLLITELYYDTPGDDSLEEWFELTNIGAAPLSLADYKIGDEEAPGGGEGMLRFPPDAAIAPGASLVIAQSAAGFRALFGFSPAFEISGDDPNVPDMLPYPAWANGSVALNNDGDELLLLDGDDIVADALSYGQSVEFMQPSIPKAARGQSLARLPAHCDSDRAGDWQASALPTPGAVSMDGACAQAPPPEGAMQPLPIGAIQGRGESSPLLNERVTFEGIVTGLLEDRNTRGAIFYTLFVQDLPGNEDGDPLTSDAIAVFHGPRRPNVLPGDHIRVQGQVTEFFGFTEIDDSGLQIELLANGQPLPPAIPLAPPAGDTNAALEPLEAMRVSLPQATVIGPTFSGCGFSVVAGSEPRRIVRQAVAEEPEGIIPVLHISDVSCGDFPQLKSGDAVRGLAGPLVYHFDQFKIVHQFAAELEVTPAPEPAPPQPPPLGEGQISVATFNLHDFFDDKRDTANDAEPVPSAEEVALKQAKLVQTISALLGCPTLLAIQEVENLQLLEGLAQALQTACHFRYAVVHVESEDARGIDLGLLADPNHVQIQSVTAHQVCAPIATDLPEISVTCPPGQDPLFSRPPMQAELLVHGQNIHVLVVHLKSKREGEQETAARRLAQAAVTAEIAQGWLADELSRGVIVLGDFNDYEQSATLAALMDGPVSLLDVAGQIALESRYTYNFSGVSQMLDTILLSPALADRLLSSQVVHVNADYPDGWSRDPARLFRSSDHDIPLITLDMRREQPLAREDVDTPATTVPTAENATAEVATATPTATTSPPAAMTAASNRSYAPWILVAGGGAMFVLFSGLLLRRVRKERG